MLICSPNFFGQRSQTRDISLFHRVLSKAAQLQLQLHTSFNRSGLHHYAPNSTKKDGKEKAEALRRMREREKWEIVEKKGEKKKTVGSVSCGCDTGVLINSEGARVSQHAFGPPSHCQAIPGAPPFSPKKGIQAANYPAKTTGPVLAWDATPTQLESGKMSCILYVCYSFSLLWLYFLKLISIRNFKSSLNFTDLCCDSKQRACPAVLGGRSRSVKTQHIPSLPKY